jgi:hypothetical protein
MILISDYIKFDNENLILKLKEYIKNNPCCKIYPNCTHPEYQSDGNIFLMDDKNINIVKENYFYFLEKILNKKLLNIISNDCWVYINNKDQKLNNIWHDHLNDKIADKDNIYISGLMYLTDTKFGTEFKSKYLKAQTIPYINRWYVWDSSISHIPIGGDISTEDRVVIATMTVIKK